LTSPPIGRIASFKGFLAVLSLLLAVTVWVVGLMDSLGRPSVAPALSQQQQEMALLAGPALPEPVRPLLVGADPAQVLLESLQEIPLDRLDDRQRLLLAALETDAEQQQRLLAAPLGGAALNPLQRALADDSDRTSLSSAERRLLEVAPADPLLRQVSCLALGGTAQECQQPAVARSTARRLLLAELLPLLALLLGVGLLLRHLWLLWRRDLPRWPRLQGLPLSLIDMVLLVAGGFVVLGEVLLPLVVSPLTSWITRDLRGPLSQAAAVVVGYSALALPPLLIIKQQLGGLDCREAPEGGWLQWRLQPVSQGLVQGGRAWLMVMPPVALTGWLMGRLLGDQGGSNPLLELVLRSRDGWALALLATTAVLLAPLFEEMVFRGVLLPVLGRSIGRGWSVLLSALVFAVAHLSIGELPPLLVLGLGLGLLRLSSGRLFPCVVMHAFWNGATFLNLILLA
jgi:membrane protease YdiL (CAAX protease family)